MFEEVLTKSVDSEAQAKIHPSFGHIIAQLSRDEAWMLFRLRDRDLRSQTISSLIRSLIGFTTGSSRRVIYRKRSYSNPI